MTNTVLANCPPHCCDSSPLQAKSQFDALPYFPYEESPHQHCIHTQKSLLNLPRALECLKGVIELRALYGLMLSYGKWIGKMCKYRLERRRPLDDSFTMGNSKSTVTNRFVASGKLHVGWKHTNPSYFDIFLFETYREETKKSAPHFLSFGKIYCLCSKTSLRRDILLKLCLWLSYQPVENCRSSSVMCM